MKNIPDYDKDPKAFALFVGVVLLGKPDRCYNGRDCQCGRPHWTPPNSINCNNWNTAMKWRDWAVENDCDDSRRFFFIEKLEDIWRSGDRELCFEQWIICDAQPHHYIEAVVRLVLKGKG